MASRLCIFGPYFLTKFLTSSKSPLFIIKSTLLFILLFRILSDNLIPISIKLKRGLPVLHWAENGFPIFMAISKALMIRRGLFGSITYAASGSNFISLLKTKFKPYFLISFSNFFRNLKSGAIFGILRLSTIALI